MEQIELHWDEVEYLNVFVKKTRITREPTRLKFIDMRYLWRSRYNFKPPHKVVMSQKRSPS